MKEKLTIYRRLQDKMISAHPLPILSHGGNGDHRLHNPCERVSNIRVRRIQAGCETLRLSAALHG